MGQWLGSMWRELVDNKGYFSRFVYTDWSQLPVSDDKNVLLFLVQGGRRFYKWWFPLWKCNVCSTSSASPVSAISQNSPLLKSLCQRGIFRLAFSGLLHVHVHTSSPHPALPLLQYTEWSNLETRGEERDGNSLVLHLQSHLFVNHFISNEGYGRNTH